MTGKPIQICALPDYMKVYAKYIDEEDRTKRFYSRIFIVALLDDGGVCFLDADTDGVFSEPEAACNFEEYKFMRNDQWISEEEFLILEFENGGRTK